MIMTVFGYLILITPCKQILLFYFSVFSVVLVLIEKIYQTPNAALNHISKHLKVHEKIDIQLCGIF